LGLCLAQLDSPLGRLDLFLEGARLRALAFPGARDRLLRELRRRCEPFELSAAPPRTDAARRLEAYFAGDLGALEAVDAAPWGTPFQREVWAAVRRIPPGRTISYGALAGLLGRPGAARAVALANARNPVPIVIPCHRVIGSDGSLTGYGGGLRRKRWLLRHEAAGTEFRLV